MKHPMIMAAAVATALLFTGMNAQAAPTATNIQATIANDNIVSATYRGGRDGRQGVESRRGEWHGVIPAYKVRRILYRQGYRHVGYPKFHRGYYYAIAEGRRGTVRLKVSARSGHVISREVLRRHYRARDGRASFSFSFGR